MKTKTYKSDILAAIHETAADLYGVGLVTKATMRHFDESCLAPIEKLSPQQIRAIREETHLSQPVFARHLNISPVAVGQWERGER
jgi:putative transcriptional regulator